MSEIKLEKRYPHSRTEDITDAFMRGYEQGKEAEHRWWSKLCANCDGAIDEPQPSKILEAYAKGYKDGADAVKPKDEPQTKVETMSCAECKHRPIGAEICEEACHYEPQTDWHYDEQDATWYPYKHEDEPQTDKLTLEETLTLNLETALSECRKRHGGCENCYAECAWREPQSGKE